MNELAIALLELTAVAETSLDYRPEFRRAIAGANAALVTHIQHGGCMFPVCSCDNPATCSREQKGN